MQPHHDLQNSGQNSLRCGRREFLLRAAGASAGFAIAHSAGARDSTTTPALDPLRSRHVVRVQSPKIVNGQIIQSTLLRTFLERGLCGVTGKQRADDAWHALLRPDDVVLLKFNRSAARELGTTPVLADELVRSLLHAGWSPQQIMVLEAESTSDRLRQLRKPDLRWQGKDVPFRSVGSDRFLAALEDASAIINVPFLKTHHLAVMSGCLKNLSHGLNRHPARFHANGCDPAIAEIVASPPIRSRLRLNVVNAIRGVVDAGPEARREQVHEIGAVLFSTSPAAADQAGFAILNEIRSLRRLPPLLRGASVPPQLKSARIFGLGDSRGALSEEILRL